MNERWHQLNRMPRNASLAVRVAWHLEHREACACRPLPASIALALKEPANKAKATRKSPLASLKSSARPKRKAR